jgi:hypothetical protein
MTDYSFSILSAHPGLTIVHHIEPNGTLWVTCGRTILKGKPGQWEIIARFPFHFPRDLFGFSRPTARAMRSDKCNLYVNRNGWVLAIRAGTVYRLDGTRLTPLFPIQGDCVLHRGICEDESGWTYFGEYFMNPQRREVHVYRLSPDLKKWEPAYTFPPDSMRHVHGIFRDPFDPAALWASLGDAHGECHLVRTRDRFATIETFGDGSQTWRAVNLFFTRTHICWLTDSNLEPNFACRMDRKFGMLEKGQAIDCSGWYGASTTDGLHLAFTTVERGPAILRQESSVLVSDDAFHWQEVVSFKKDSWKPVRLFKYGVISCPSGEWRADDAWLSGEGLIGLDGASLHVSITRKGSRS